MHRNPLAYVFLSFWVIFVRFRAFFACFDKFSHVFACFCIFFCSWSALGCSWGALGALLGALGALLECSWALLGRSWGALGQEYEKKSSGICFWKPNLEPQIHSSWLKNPLKIDVKKKLVLNRFFTFFCIFRELLAKARTLNFVAPVDVLQGFSKVGV